MCQAVRGHRRPEDRLHQASSLREQRPRRQAAGGPGQQPGLLGGAAWRSLVGPPLPFPGVRVLRRLRGREARCPVLPAVGAAGSPQSGSAGRGGGRGPRAAPPESPQVAMRLLPGAAWGGERRGGLSRPRCGWASSAVRVSREPREIPQPSCCSSHSARTWRCCPWFSPRHPKRDALPLWACSAGVPQRETRVSDLRGGFFREVLPSGPRVVSKVCNRRISMPCAFGPFLFTL